MSGAVAIDEVRFARFARRPLIFALAVAIVLCDFVLVDAAHRFGTWLGLPEISAWNWLGKTVSIAFSCVLLACSPSLRQNVGLRWRQAPGSTKLSIGAFMILLICATAIGLSLPQRAFSADALMFQFFMPAIDEELLLRGIVLALLERAFGQSPMSCRLRFGFAALITVLLFAIPHAVTMDAGRLGFSPLLFSVIAVWAATVTLLRTRSGSLLWPVLCHSAWDGLIFLLPMLR